MFHFSNLDENQKILSNKNKKVIGKFKIETPNKIWNDEFVCLRSEMYSFKCGDYIKKNVFLNLNQSISNLKNIKNGLDGKENQIECDNYLLRSINHDMCLQKVKKLILSIFDDKRCYESNTKSLPWNLKNMVLYMYFEL